jgi:hypothetical protein
MGIGSLFFFEWILKSFIFFCFCVSAVTAAIAAAFRITLISVILLQQKFHGTLDSGNRVQGGLVMIIPSLMEN